MIFLQETGFKFPTIFSSTCACADVFPAVFGDTVYKRQMKNVSRKGGKMEPGWMGPYRYQNKSTISMQHPTLIVAYFLSPLFMLSIDY